MEQGRLILQRAPKPIEEPVTKLGGLPVWVDEPAWPVSAATGEQMLFIGQVAIDQPLFPVKTPRIAYLFVTVGLKQMLNSLGRGTQKSSSKMHPLVVSQPLSMVHA